MSGDLLKSVGNALFKKGASEATKQAVKSTTKEVIKGYLKAMLEEGAEEGVQQAFEFFGDGGKLTTADGEFDNEAFQKLLQESGQAAALGAVGGGIFHGGANLINAGKAKLSENGGIKGLVDNTYTKAVNKGAVSRLAEALKEAMNGGVNGDTKFARLTNEVMNDVNQVRTAQGLEPLTKRQVTAYEKAVNGHLASHIGNNGYKTPREAAEAAFAVLTSQNPYIIRADQSGVRSDTKNTILASEPADKRSESVVLANAPDGGTSLKGISPRKESWVKKESSSTRRLLDDSLVGEGRPTSLPTYDSVASPSLSGRQTIDSNSISQNPNTVNNDSTNVSSQTSSTPYTEDGTTAVKIGPDGSTSAMSDVEFASSVGNEMPDLENNMFMKNTEVTFGEYDTNDRATDLAEMTRYYNRYGDDFYEKMPNYLQDAYEILLDSQPKDKNGVYTDPVTGGRSIDEDNTSGAKMTYAQYQEKIGDAHVPNGRLPESTFNKVAQVLTGKNAWALEYISPADVYNRLPNGTRELKSVGDYLEIAESNKAEKEKLEKAREQSHKEFLKQQQAELESIRYWAKETGLSEENIDRLRKAERYRNSQRALDFVNNHEAVSHGAGGYKSDLSMSNRAGIAMSNNIFPAEEAGKRLGVPAEQIERVLSPSEWHHVGKSAEPTNFYDISRHIEAIENMDDWKTSHEYDNEIREIKDMLGQGEEKEALPANATSSQFLDRFGNKFTEENVPVSALKRSKEFQPRTTASGKGTSDNVFKNGYNEGQVDQPMLVRKIPDGTYEVLGGHSRTEGLERRAEAGLPNPETVKARVYDGITDKQALQISQAANQGGQYESIIDMAKSISDARNAGLEPSVQKQNLVKGYSMDDYQSLHDVLSGDKRLQDLVFHGAISQEDMLSVARTARKLGFDPDRTRNLVRVAYERGDFNRKGVEAVMKRLATTAKNIAQEEATSSLFDMTDYGKALDSQADILAAEKAERGKRTFDNSVERILKNPEALSPEQKQNLASKLGEINSSEYNDVVGRNETERARDMQTPKTEVQSLTEILNAPKNQNYMMTLLRGVNNKVKSIVKNATGRDISGYNHVIDSSAAQHALKKHSADQIPLKPEHLELIRGIIKNPDTVNYEGKNNRHLDVIKYTKNYGDRVVYLEEVRNGRHQLTMNTMYWQQAPKQKTASLGGTQQATNPATDPRRASSRPERLVDNSIPHDNTNVKQKTATSRSYESESETLPDNFDVKHYVSDQVEAQKKRSKVPLRERIADTTAELKHYLVDEAVAYERYIKDKNERLNLREGVDRVRSSRKVTKPIPPP